MNRWNYARGFSARRMTLDPKGSLMWEMSATSKLKIFKMTWFIQSGKGKTFDEASPSDDEIFCKKRTVAKIGKVVKNI